MHMHQLTDKAQAWKAGMSITAALRMGASKARRVSASGLGTGMGSGAGWGRAEDKSTDEE